jgi:hypothetical protein
MCGSKILADGEELVESAGLDELAGIRATRPGAVQGGFEDRCVAMFTGGIFRPVGTEALGLEVGHPFGATAN